MPTTSSGRSPRKKPDITSLSARQKRILEVIHDAVVLRGYAPTIREIGDAAGLKSTSSVAYQLDELEKKGFLKRDPNKPRAVDIRHLEETSGTPSRKPSPSVEARPEDSAAPNYVPIVGQIAAGSPILAEQNVDGYFAMPSEIVGDGELFMLKVVGDSMSLAGILNGDWVVVRYQSTVEIGEIAAAMIGGEATVKEFHRDSTGVWLLPHSDHHDPIPGDDAEIMGKVVSVFRRL